MACEKLAFSENIIIFNFLDVLWPKRSDEVLKKKDVVSVSRVAVGGKGKIQGCC